MATVNAQGLAVAGTSPTMSAASGGGDVVDTGDTVFLVVNSGSTTANLTITTPGTVSGLAIADNVIAIPANAGTVATAPPVLIPLPTSLYGDANGQAALSWSAVTNIKFAVIRR
jgi:hypothetical protein